MNAYQKAAVLAVRIAAAFIFVTAFFEIAIDALNHVLSPRPAAAVFMAPLISDGVRAILGLFLWLFAMPLGRFLGKGLD